MMNCQNNTKQNLIKEIGAISDNFSLATESSSEQSNIPARHNMAEEASENFLRKSNDI